MKVHLVEYSGYDISVVFCYPNDVSVRHDNVAVTFRQFFNNFDDVLWVYPRNMSVCRNYINYPCAHDNLLEDVEIFVS